MSNNLFKKVLVVGFIVLFIGLAFIPSFNALSIHKSFNNSNNDLVEITIEICREYDVEKYNILISKKEMNELGNLIDSVKAEIDKAESKEDILEIYDKSIVSFNELGIFPKDVVVDEIQQLVKNEIYVSNEEKSITYIDGKGMNDDGNTNCQVVGNISNVLPIHRVAYRCNSIINSMFNLVDMLHERFPNSILYALVLTALIPSIFTLVDLELLYIILGIGLDYHIGSCISFSEKITDNNNGQVEYRHSKGWVNTNGDNGKIEWNGTLYGQIEEFIFYFADILFSEITYIEYIGITGFTGFMIYGDLDYDYFYYIEGNAKKVSLGYEPISEN